MRMSPLKLVKKKNRVLVFSVNGKAVAVKDCRGFRSLRGLMFSRSAGALISGNSVWMPFVRWPLTLYFLDKEFGLLDTQKAVPLTLNPKTWKTYSYRGARYVLEVVNRRRAPVQERAHAGN